jgi:hypothetical protein
MSLVALGGHADLPDPALYLWPFHVFLAGSVDQHLEVAALLVTLECCTPKNVWGFVQIHRLKLVVLVRTRMTGEIATPVVGKMQKLAVLGPVPSGLMIPRQSPMRENDLFTATARAGDRTNNQVFALSQNMDSIN